MVEGGEPFLQRSYDVIVALDWLTHPILDLTPARMNVFFLQSQHRSCAGCTGTLGHKPRQLQIELWRPCGGDHKIRYGIILNRYFRLLGFRFFGRCTRLFFHRLQLGAVSVQLVLAIRIIVLK